MTINCAIIDDEPLAAGLLESYAKKTPYLTHVGTYNSAITAMKDLRDNPAQLLFLDIQMPELSGIEFAKILPKDTKIIFTIKNSNFPKTQKDRSGHGIGLQQVQRRLDLAYPNRYEWTKGLCDDGTNYQSIIKIKV